MVSAANKLPLEVLSAPSSPTKITTSPPKDRSSFQFRPSDIEYLPHSPIAHTLPTETVTEAASQPTETVSQSTETVVQSTTDGNFSFYYLI